MKNSPRPCVVAVGAHSDDVALQCGGTLAALKKKGARIVQVVMTTSPSIDHFGSVNTSDQTNRKEVEHASQLLGIETVIVLHFLNNKIPYSTDSIQTLNRIFHEQQATLIITHSPNESQQDHQNTSRSVISAARKYRNILMFEEHIGRPSATNLPIHPTIYFDISQTLRFKNAAIKCFRSQYNRLGGVRALRAWEYRSRVRGAEVGVAAAEAYEPVKVLLDDVLSFFTIPAETRNVNLE